MYSIRRTCNLLHWKCVDILGHHGNLLRQINIDEAESVLAWDTPCQASFAMSSIRFRALGRAPLALAHKIIFNGMHLLPCRSTIITRSIWHVFTSRKSGWWQCTHRRTWIQCDAAARLESIDTSWEYSSNLTGAYLDILHEITTSGTTFKDKTLVHSFPRSHNAHSHQPQPISRYPPPHAWCSRRAALAISPFYRLHPSSPSTLNRSFISGAFQTQEVHPSPLPPLSRITVS